uniref:Tudor domain-containing protein n=2 Tax=Clastoptera arizonana TaxID=38151 RepID=A0A1B6E2W6_9HEMI
MAEKEVLFLRGSTDLDSEDVWDDTLLIRMWDKSLEKLQKGLLNNKDLGNMDKPEKDSSISKKNDVFLDKQRKNSDDNLDVGSNCISEEDSSNNPQIEYKINQQVRAPYSFDGLEYEATIININEEEGLCLVKFIGYENVEEVSLADLTPSHGRNAIRTQKFQARQYEKGVADVRSYEDCRVEDFRKSKYQNPNIKTKFFRSNFRSHDATEDNFNAHLNHHNIQHSPEFPMTNFPQHMRPPQPIMPPPMGLFHCTHSEEEAYSSMLMSWYLNGYHTGYYEGLRHGKEAALRQYGCQS